MKDRARCKERGKTREGIASRRRTNLGTDIAFCGRRDAVAWEVKYDCYRRPTAISILAAQYWRGTKSELICLLIFHNSADRSGGSWCIAYLPFLHLSLARSFPAPFSFLFFSLSPLILSIYLSIFCVCMCVCVCVCVGARACYRTTFLRLVPLPLTILKGAAKPLWLCEPNVRVYDRPFVSLMKESLTASYASFYTPTYVCGQVAVVKFSTIPNTRRSLLWICLRPRRLTHWATRRKGHHRMNDDSQRMCKMCTKISVDE